MKREIQRRKAVACEERKKAAAAIASKPGPSEKSAGKKRKEPTATAPNPTPACNFQRLRTSDPTNAAYYAAVEVGFADNFEGIPWLRK